MSDDIQVEYGCSSSAQPAGMNEEPASPGIKGRH